MSFQMIVTQPSDLYPQIVANPERPTFFGMTSSDPVIRANQLEQNIKFLQEQHQIMLAGLHNEVESLKQKNRDLQFQIIFPKETRKVSGKAHTKKTSLSCSQAEVMSFQVEVLERNIAELRISLSESKTRNFYLQNVINEQRKKILDLENEKLDMVAIGKRIGKENLLKKMPGTLENKIEELQDKFEQADRLARRLRRENEEQRKEIVSLRTSLTKNKNDSRRNDGNNSNRNYYRNGQSQNSRFPPLQNYSHWKNSSDHQGNKNSDKGGNRGKKDSDTLPYLKDRNNASTSTGYSNPAYNNYQGGNYKRGFYYNRRQDDHRNNGRSFKRDQAQKPDNQR